MIGAREVWRIIRGHIPRKRWVSREEIYGIIELHGNLDADDWRPPSSRSKMPRWKILVRDIMAIQVKRGKIRARKKLNHLDDAAG